ncbi:MAG TPA: helix-turn-helix domain-containing protein [Stackebrandtia sp.]|uniref:PucR family transcriptional regulator n=1 Tax=Stackebrandtia sp. TaxID=2023065 RepID=UPI002D524A41|nr:helix-turn-helix domain-containing protein [Stackebrandtia sp.]HZE39118.1 helix-turn-helix domain-containing protein [Stackebrandtia sp.]
MSDPDRPLCLGGVPMHEVVRQRTPDLAERLTEVIASEVDSYGKFTASDLRRFIVPLVALNLHLIAETFERRRAPGPEEMAPLGAAAGRGVQDGVPLEDILSAYHLGGRQAMAALFSDAAPADYEDMTAAYALLLDYNQTVSATLCSSYTIASEALRSQEQDARHTVVSALLSGERPVNAGALAGVRLAQRYVVLTAAFDPHPEEAEGKEFAIYAGRSKLHRIRAVLDDYGPEPVLSVLDVSGGLILAPAQESMMDWDSAVALVDRVASAAGAPIRAAGELADIDAVSAAARLTQEVLDVVRCFGKAPGLYRLSDVSLEYQLTRPSQALDALAQLLDPLDENPDLLRTLQAYIENGLDRRKSAGVLHVHPNTVDYRLRRVVALTGLDPLEPAHLQRIGAALAARRSRVDDAG